MKIEDVEGYSQARAEYDGSLTAAKAAGDELAELKSELTWRDRREGFRTEAARLEAAAAALDNARSKAKTDFPHAPEVVYASLADPEAILQAAKAAHDAVSAAMSQTEGFKSPSQPWPQPPVGNPAPPQGSHPFDDPVVWNEEMEKIRNMPKPPNQGIDNPRFKKMMDYTVERLWNSPLKNSK